MDRVLAVHLTAEVTALEIVAVDDGASDGTREILLNRAKLDPRIGPIFHEENAGKEAAIRTAIRGTRGGIGIFQNADLEYDPKKNGFQYQ